MKLSANDRTWLILLALLVVAVALFALEKGGVFTRESEGGETVWDVESGQVVGLRVVEPASGAATSVERDASGEWRVTEPFSRPAESTDCILLTSLVANLRVQRTIAEPPASEIGAYGLITPTYTIEVRVDDGRTLVLEVGAQAGSNTYVRRQGEQAVLLVSSYSVDQVTRIVVDPPAAEPTPGMPVTGP